MQRTRGRRVGTPYLYKRTPNNEDSQKKHKTEICRRWESGNCPFKGKCAFAHGEHELKPKADVPSNYRTKKCKQFFKEGFCSYGPRCQFSHQSDQNKTAPNTPVKDRKDSNAILKKRLPVFMELENKNS